MPNYTVKDEGSGKTITFEWNDPDPPTDSDMQEIFSQAGQVEQLQGNFFQRSLQDIKQRGRNIAAEFEPRPGETRGESLQRVGERGLRTTGEVAGGIGDVTGEAIKSVYTTLTPQSLQTNIQRGWAAAQEADRLRHEARITQLNKERGLDLRARTLGQGIQEDILTPLQQKHPELLKNLTAMANIGAVAMMSGKPKGFTLAKLAKVPSRIEQLNAIKNTATRNLSEKWGIPTTLGEDIGNVTLQKSETLLEKIPVIGIRKFREKQVLAADDAAKGFLARYIANPKNPDFWGNKEFVDSLYDSVKETASKINVTSKAGTTSSTAKELLERYPSIFESIQDMKTKKIIKDVIGDTSPSVQGISATGNITFDDLWSLRKGLGVAKETAKTQGNIEAVGVLGKIKSAVDVDIDSIGKAAGSNISAKLRAANDAYKHYNVKYEMIQRAYDKALGKVGAGEMFSPKKFSTELKNMVYKDVAIRKSGLFKPSEIDEMTGLANIMQTVKRAGQFAENPPTGNRMVDLMMGGGFGYGAAAHPGATAIAASTAGAMRFLTTTKSGKNLVRAASRMRPDSESLKAIAFKAMNEGKRFVPVAGTATLEKEVVENAE